MKFDPEKQCAYAEMAKLTALYGTPLTEAEMAEFNTLRAREMARYTKRNTPQPDLLEESDMARPFSFPAVQSLAVGESTTILGQDHRKASQKIRDYAKRAGRRFTVTSSEGVTTVTRQADPERQEQDAA